MGSPADDPSARPAHQWKRVCARTNEHHSRQAHHAALATTVGLLALTIGASPAARAASPGTRLSSATPPHPQSSTFQKGSQQFCIADLSAEDQSRFYSKIVNIGASFSHGCMGCDSTAVWQGYTELSDDQFWVRRNFLSYFFRVAPWKKPEEWNFEHYYILENDPKTRPAALLRSTAARTAGYTGEWQYEPATGAFGLLSPSGKSEMTRQDPSLVSAAALVGGPLLQREKNGRIKPRTSGPSGVLMRTVPGQFAATGAVPKSVYDLAVDGGFLDLQFALLADPAIVEALNKTGWRDPALRELAISTLASRLAEFDAGLILGVDTLFWDTVFEALYHLRETGPRSPLVRLVFAFIQNLPIGKRIFDQERREFIRADFLEALARVSRGHNGRPAVPVLLARLAEDPISKFKDKRYMPVLATLFGQFFEQVTGIDLMTDILRWLERVSFIQLPAVAGPTASAWVPRNGGIDLDELGLSFSADDVRELQRDLERLRKEAGQDAVGSEDGSGGFSNPSRGVRFAFDPIGGAEVTMFPNFTRGIVGRLLGEVLVELPAFVEGLEQVFASVNRSVVALGARTDNNVHMLDVDEFYENLGYFLNPRTAHPSVLGAERMARMVERTICGRTFLAPDNANDPLVQRRD